MFSSDLCDLIAQYFAHRETYTGFNTARLATMLSRFDIRPEPGVKRRGGRDNGIRWYRRDVFDEWFIRYGFVTPPEKSIIEADDLSEDAANCARTQAATLQPEVPECSSVSPYEADADAAAATPQAEETATPLQGEMDVTYPNADVAESVHKNRLGA